MKGSKSHGKLPPPRTMRAAANDTLKPIVFQKIEPKEINSAQRRKKRNEDKESLAAIATYEDLNQTPGNMYYDINDIKNCGGTGSKPAVPISPVQ